MVARHGTLEPSARQLAELNNGHVSQSGRPEGRRRIDFSFATETLNSPSSAISVFK